ncbi:MAG: protein kinase [Myxococcota bacterium]
MDQVGAFVLEAPIGAGGMGEIWRAHHITGATVAIKLIRAQFAQNDTFFLRFQDEVRALARLSHPNIVQVWDSGQSLRGPWLAMEWADGGIVQVVPSWDVLRTVLEDALAGLAHAHARGVLHRDIKPSNILSVGGRWKLADFGIARLDDRRSGAVSADADPARTSSQGTPMFMAPEQIRGDVLKQGPHTDLYGLGGVAWSLVTRTPPFSGNTTAAIFSAHLQGELGPLLPVMDIPEGFEEWLRWLLARQPAQRPAFAADALDALRSLGPPTAPGVTMTVDVRAPLPLKTIDFDGQKTVFSDETLSMDANGAHPEQTGVSAAGVGFGPATLPSHRPADPPPLPLLPAVGAGIYALRPSPLVGRTAERDALWDALAAVHQSQTPKVVVLHGPSGRGKTRLARWLGALAVEVGAARQMTLRHSPAGGAGDGLGPALAAALGVASLLPEPARTHLAAQLDDPFEARPLIDEALLGGRGPRTVRHAAVLRWMARADRPWVVHVDDAQWASEALDFIGDLKAGTVPVLAVLTVRDEDVTDTVEQRLTALADETIRLGALPTKTHQSLIRKLLGLSGPLADQIAERTDGNPLFAVHLVRDWVQRGLLKATRAGFSLVEGAAIPLPPSLQVTWEAQRERLLHDQPPWWRRALSLAALLGQQVNDQEWADATGQSIADVRAALLEMHLAEETDQGWMFVHGMLRETILLQPGAQDPGLHAACADAIQKSGGPIPHERRARHFLAAGMPGEMIREQVNTARCYEQRSELDTVEAILAQVEEHLAHYDIPLNSMIRHEAEIFQASFAITFNRRAHAMTMLQHLLPQDLSPLNRAETHSQLSRLAMLRGEYAESQYHVEQSLIHLKKQPDMTIEALSQRQLVTLAYLQGETERARTLLVDALTIPLDDPVYQVDIRRVKAALLTELGELEEAEGAARDALQMAQRRLMRLGTAYAQLELGALIRRRGRIEEAMTTLEAARTKLAVFGALRAAMADAQITITLAVQNRWDAAQALASQIEPILTENRRVEAGMIYLLLAVVAARRGEVEDAAGWLDQIAARTAQYRPYHIEIASLLRVFNQEPVSEALQERIDILRQHFG